MQAGSAEINPGFMVLQGNRLEDLRDLTLQWLRAHPLAPLEPETVAVQSNGMAQWLRAAMAQSPQTDPPGLGVATSLDLVFPSRLAWQCYRAVLGSHRIAEQAPLDKGGLQWRLLRILPQLPERPEFAPLTTYIHDDALRRYQLAGQLADQFDQYQVYRADWLTDWAQGNDRLGDEPIPAEQRWQPALWREVLDDVQSYHQTPPTSLAGRAQIHQLFLNKAAALTTRPAGLPRRIVVFGISSLPPQVLDVLGAIARFTQVLFCLQNPCRHYWGDIVEDRHLFDQAYRRSADRKIPSHLQLEQMHQHAHPLLAAWGKQGRDLMRLADQFDEINQHQQRPVAEVDVFQNPSPGGILQQIQDDILELRSIVEIQEEQRHWSQADQSLQFYRAHSPLREVEILQDQLLAAFDRHPDLQPRDVIVMVPDMAVYAPAISAVFGQIAKNDARYLPYAISDRTDAGEHPIYQALQRLLTLPQSRLGSSELFDLTEVAALRARFDIAGDDLGVWMHWADQARARWGLDREHRADLGLPGEQQNSWRFAIDRLLMSYLNQPQSVYAHIHSVPHFDDSAGSVIGPLYDLIERLGFYRQQLNQLRTVSEWVVLFSALLEDFFDATAISEQTVLADEQVLTEREAAISVISRLQDALSQWQEQQQQSDFNEAVPCQIAAEGWLACSRAHRLQQRFLVGSINFATLMPMRSIPFRQVWLLGLDDQSYPRRTPVPDFDLMQSRYRPGDRSRREDDRYLFLEALLSAREQLSISWVGRDIRDNHERPASVLVNQLLDHIERGWVNGTHLADGKSRVVDHPLQPFSPNYYHSDQSALFTYNHDWAPIAPCVDSASSADLLPVTPPEVIEQHSLGRFFVQPGLVFFQDRLNIPAERDQPGHLDDEPFMPTGGLDGYYIKQHLISEITTALSHHPEPQRVREIEKSWLNDRLGQAWQQLKGEGVLPFAPFDQILHQQTIPACKKQLDDWLALLAMADDHQWLSAAAESLVFDNAHLALDATNERSYTIVGKPARVVLHTGRLHGKSGSGGLRWDKIARYWVDHLLAHIRHDQTMTTYLVSESNATTPQCPTERATTLTGLSVADARSALQALTTYWQYDYNSPIPAEPNVSIDALCSPPEKQRDNARKQFEKTQQYNDTLLRIWQQPEAFFADQQWLEWSALLYRQMAANTSGKHQKKLGVSAHAAE